MYQSLKDGTTHTPPIVVVVDDVKISSSATNRDSTIPIIDERTGLPSSHLFGSVGDLQGVVVLSKTNKKKSSVPFLLIAVIAAILLFIFKK